LKLQFKRPLKTFFAAATVIALVACIGECLLLSRVPAAGAHYGAYLAFLLLAVFGGGFLLSAVTWFITTAETRETRLQRIRISELERSIENLENVASRREEFIGSFAHELKTPLTAIIGYADMLRSKEMAPKSRFTAAGYIFSEGKRLEALSLKLMDIIVAGKQEFEPRRFEVGYFIRSVAAVTVPSLSNDGMTLDMRWEPGEIEVEPDLFKTLLINLVDNARKASRKGSVIELFGKAEDGGYALYVRDHGRGMPQAELERITEPFYMIDKSRSRAQNGAGLGLALCQRIAELHGTKLEYESEEGQGTTVRILLKGGPALEEVS
jgi:signal transduction histidine kinase